METIKKSATFRLVEIFFVLLGPSSAFGLLTWHPQILMIAFWKIALVKLVFIIASLTTVAFCFLALIIIVSLIAESFKKGNASKRLHEYYTNISSKIRDKMDILGFILLIIGVSGAIILTCLIFSATFLSFVQKLALSAIISTVFVIIMFLIGFKLIILKYNGSYYKKIRGYY